MDLKTRRLAIRPFTAEDTDARLVTEQGQGGQDQAQGQQGHQHQLEKAAAGIGRVAALHAGVDLEMPYVGADHDKEILAAVADGTLPQEELDSAALRVLKLALYDDGKKTDGKAEHHDLAAMIARESAVLLKNDNNILPLPAVNF